MVISFSHLHLKVLWHTGQVIWVRDEKLPKHFHDKQFEMNLKTEVAFGQPRKIAVITETNKTTMGNVTELEEIIM